MKTRSVWLHRCDGCRFLQSNLPPGPGTGIGGLEPLRRRNFEEILDRVQPLHPLAGARVLEVGSAWGWFLEAATRRGAIVHGIEGEQANAVETAARGFSVEHGLFPHELKDKGPYDIVIFNDVFEHIPKPETLPSYIQQILKPSGLLIINLPSTDGALFRMASMLNSVGFSTPYERLWQKGFESPHVSMFNHDNLKQLIHRNSGLREEMFFSLPYLSREGLRTRVYSSHNGVQGFLLMSGLWVFSFLWRLLPPDAIVSIFRAPR